MNDKHSEQWELLKKQGKKHRRERAIMVFVIIVLVIVNFVLANIVWQARHNNETASADTPEIAQATEAVALLSSKPESPKKKERVIRDTGG